MTDDYPTIGDITVSDERCDDCGADLMGSFSMATIDAQGVNDFGQWSGCWACLIMDYFKGLGE